MSSYYEKALLDTWLLDSGLENIFLNTKVSAAEFHYIYEDNISGCMQHILKHWGLKSLEKVIKFHLRPQFLEQ